MKKLFSLICLLSLVFCFAGCKESAEASSKVVLGEKFTDFEGVDYSITKVVLSGEGFKIYTELVNNTEYVVVYNPDYCIERFENGNWISCKKDTAEDYKGGKHTVSAGQTVRYINETYSDYDFSEKGKYRIITDCDVYKDGVKAESQKCSVFAVFTLSE